MPAPPPAPRVIVTLHDVNPPWATVHSEALGFLDAAYQTTVERLLASIDSGLQVTKRRDGFAYIIKPNEGVKRTRAQMTAVIRNLAHASRWHLRWGSDPSD